MNLFNHLYDNLLMEDFKEDQETASLNALIRNEVGYNIWKFKNKPENQEIINKAKENVFPEFEQLKSLAGLYLTHPKGKNNSHLVELTNFYLQIKDFNTLAKEYKVYMSIPALYETNIIKKEKDFGKWASVIHSKQSIQKLKSETKSDPQQTDINTVSINNTSEDPNKKYEDEGVIVFLANDVSSTQNSIKNCVKYGKDTTLCISGSSARTYYHDYRWNKKLTTYFVWLKNSKKYIIIDASENGEYSYNPIKPNNDNVTPQKTIIKKHPELQKAFENNIFVSVPITGKELEYYKKFFNKSITKFNTLEDLVAYIEVNGLDNIDKKEWAYIQNDIDKSFLPFILKTATEVVEDNDIPNELIKQFPALEKRYWIKKQQLVDRAMVELEDDDYVFFSKDSYKLLAMKKPEEIPDFIITSIGEEAEESLKYGTQLMAQGKPVPDEIIQGVAQNAQTSWKYITYMMEHTNIPFDDTPDPIFKSCANGEENIGYILSSFKRMGKTYEQLPKKIKNIFFDNNFSDIAVEETAAYLFFLNEKNINIPKELIERIALDPNRATDLTKSLIDIFIEKNINVNNIYEHIPRPLIDSILSTGDSAYTFSEYLTELYKGDLLRLPDEVINGIAIEPETAFWFSKKLLSLGISFNEFSNSIQDALAKSPVWAHTFAMDIVYRNNRLSDIPNEIINSISKDLEMSFDLANYCIENDSTFLTLPKAIINTISKNGQFSTDILVIALEKEISIEELPSQMLYAVSLDPYFCYRVIRSVLGTSQSFETIYNKLVSGISKSRPTLLKLGEFLASYGYIDFVQYPKEIKEAILSSPEFSYTMTKALIDTEKVTTNDVPELIASIAKDPESSFDLAKYLIYIDVPINEFPISIIQALSGNSKFTELLKRKQIKVPTTFKRYIKGVNESVIPVKNKNYFQKIYESIIVENKEKPIRYKIYIREPWATLLLDGVKKIETSTFSLPERFIGIPLYVQNEHRKITGIIKFSGSKRYTSAEEFDKDSKLHGIEDSTDRYHFNQRIRTYGWFISYAEKFDEPKQGKPFKGQFRIQQITELT